MTTRYNSFQEYLEDNYQGPFCATDILIRHNDGNKEGIVLIERKYPPYGLAVPGGLAERINIYDNAIKEAKEETGLDVLLDNPEQPLCVLGKIGQDPRAFIISITYTAQGSGILKPHKDEDAKSAAVYTLEEISNLLKEEKTWAFPQHHRRILELYLAECGYHGRK